MRRLAILVGVVLIAFHAPRVRAQAAALGRWTTLPYTMPINPVHMALLHNGKVLVVAGSGNVAAETHFQAAVLDPESGSIQTQSLSWDMFCNGMVILPDGRAFINGGNLQYDPFHGQPKNAVFNPSTNLFADVRPMAHGRWYPTTTVLGDGRVMSFSGLTETGGTNTTVEIFTAGSGWSQEYPAGWTPPLYPRLHLLPTGKVVYTGSGTGTRTFNPATGTWSSVLASTNYTGTRTYGTSVLLPLRPSDGYKATVMILGGGDPATTSTELLDTSVTPFRWVYGPPMSQPRIEISATILPNGKVLAMGGSKNNEDAATASLNADLYDPQTNTFSSAGANAFPRLYHSAALLLPDATVLLAGGNPQRGTYESRMEIYSPSYLFNADGTDALRPAIVSVTPGAVGYGSTFHVQTPDAADIQSVVLVRPGAPTHAFDMEQRLVELSFTEGAGDLTVTAPPNGNVAPPGYYMLFILNAAGVPSVASFVQLSTSIANQAPTATIISPAADVTINAGQSVSFSGRGSDPDGTISAYSWLFPGGTPASSSVATPGSVRYATPGKYVASFGVTDNGGVSSATVTRTITVPDFALSVTPGTRTLAPGGTTSFDATVSPVNGFTGIVTFSVGGLPTGASASFAPTSIAASGTTRLTIATVATLAPGSYPLTITGVSGQLTHSVALTLVVSADFTISVTPSSRTITRGGQTTYSVVVGAQGFSGTITLSVSGLPKFASARFSTSTITNSGTSVLTINTNKNIARDTYVLTVTASGGGRTHSAAVSLIVQ